MPMVLVKLVDISAAQKPLICRSNPSMADYFEVVCSNTSFFFYERFGGVGVSMLATDSCY